MARISVPEAAARLGVVAQRVRQRIQDGSLPAERVGGQWIIDEKDLARIADSSAPGRPLSERSAWALVAAAEDNDALLHSLSAPDRSRARARLRKLAAAQHDDPQESLRLLSVFLRNRAARCCYLAAGRDLNDLRNDPRIRLSGLSHPESGLASGDVVEGYVSVGDLDDVTQDYLLRDMDRDRANVILHVVSTDAEEILPFLSHAWNSLLMAADLSEYDGPRERHRAMEVLNDLAQQAQIRGPQARRSRSEGRSE
ncbi:helix-turn-helix domain-containing protein [Nocardioides jensenii]|uniref:helix-turn-helix domain-containing protein n=1 Tax=Nocardioides jensenii TaxID=1843 RepID=UPI00083058B0|nr:helix-turn-helix domain-containing protein [Nocardioides jensenii]